MVKKRKEVVEEKEKRKKRKILITKKKLIKLVNSPAAVPKPWWAKAQVYGFTEVVKREYRSDRELFNLIDFQEMIRREFDYKDWVLKVLKQ